MTKYIECDVCEKTDTVGAPFIEMTLPGELMDHPGETLQIDVCGADCLTRIGMQLGADVPAVPVPPEPAAAPPQGLEDEVDDRRRRLVPQRQGVPSDPQQYPDVTVR